MSVACLWLCRIRLPQHLTWNALSPLLACSAAVTDGDVVNTTEVTVTLTVSPPQSLVARNDAYTGQASKNITVAAGAGLLSNDSSPNASPQLSVLAAGPLSPSNAGQLTSWGSDGSFVFLPAPLFAGGCAHQGDWGRGVVFARPRSMRRHSGAPGQLARATIPFHSVRPAPTLDPALCSLAGTVTFPYTMTDAGTLLNGTATVTLVVGTVPPVAVADTYSCPYKFGCNISAPGVLANDTGDNGGTLVVVGAPVLSLLGPGGTLSVAQNGSFVYAPPR